MERNNIKKRIQVINMESTKNNISLRCRLSLGYLIAEVQDRKSHKIIIQEEKENIVDLVEESAERCTEQELAEAHNLIKDE